VTAFVAVLCLYAARLIHVEPPVHPVLFGWDLCHSVPFLLCSCVSLYVRHTTIMGCWPVKTIASLNGPVTVLLAKIPCNMLISPRSTMCLHLQ
jgi:hypothetical protein